MAKDGHARGCTVLLKDNANVLHQNDDLGNERWTYSPDDNMGCN
jgi:hypothetical protein